MKDLYAVIGNPIKQSKSPIVHKHFAQITNQNLDYIAIEGILDPHNPNAFTEQVRELFYSGKILGLNVTTPFKLDALALADVVLERAKQAGASNTLKWENGKIIADNFDGIGILRDIEENIGQPLKNKRVLIVGAGGATRGTLVPFLEAQPQLLTIANRTVDKAVALANEFLEYGNIMGCGYDDLLNENYDIIINFTSSGLFGEAPPVPPKVFENAALAYESSYGKGKTEFLKLAEANGNALLRDGVGMLIEQAADSFAWWRGIRPATKTVFELLAP